MSDPDTQEETERRGNALAEQELRLVSALVVLIGLGVFLALPFVLSIGAVVFLPIVTAIVLTIILSPLADRMNGVGVPNGLAALVSLIVFFAIVLAALGLILQPAVVLFEGLPVLVDGVGARFSELRNQFAWIGDINRQLGELLPQSGGREVVLAGPSWLEEVAFATPTVVVETILTLLMAFFMIEARVRLRQKLLLGRSNFGSSIKAARVLREVQDRVAAYILTVGWINALVGAVVTLGAWLLGLEVPIMWGGLAAILNFLPYIGPTVMIGLLALYGIGTSETVIVGLIPATAYLGLHAVEANVVTPSILGARFTMNPVMILIALSYFTWVWGVLGALLSVPILLILTALFDHVGRPNLIGFIFGEPLFPSLPIGDEEADITQAQ
ncbi:AI-2E family transporter [Erythrobacter litoralis]|uniref:AI-2E family transporter n=1 Tax=Erythrobacter litoralis TaxID=39960 RepID=UPI002434CB5D|nr:AI-2E family transporter [Erythrobacter litoralis]MDG6077943.1 AI-2E family transporter [Erythrobacter litoralis]